MKTVKLVGKNIRQFKNGYPLVQVEDLALGNQEPMSGEWVKFTTAQGEYLGSGYLGEQNKGRGWILTQAAEQRFEAPFFEQLFRQALARRQDFLASTETTAFRLFNGEGDGLGGVTIDLYETFALFSWYNASLYQHRELIMAAFHQVAPFVTGSYEKNRFEGAGIPESQHIYGQEAPEPLLVKENGVTFATYLNEGMMTGIFLDQKEVRGRLVDGLAAGKSVLNTFSYTGAFSVAATMGGARETVSVDLAKRSRAKTEEMFAVNEIPLTEQRIVVMDVFEYINYARRKGLTFEMIILDPPSFARNKKRTFSVAQNYTTLVTEVLDLLAPKGVLIASTNAANVSYAKFKGMVDAGCQQTQRPYHLFKEERLPADFVVAPNFPEGDYLKVLMYQMD